MTELSEQSSAHLLRLLEPYLPASLMVYGTIRLSRGSIVPTRVYSTFLNSLSPPPDTSLSHYTTIVPLPHPSIGQIRVFDTLESDPNPSPAELQDGKQRVVQALKMYMEEEVVEMVGGVHEYWLEAVQDSLGDGRERPRCGVWVSPTGWNVGFVDSRREGYRMERGREEDAEIISQGSDISRNVEYYLSRIPYSTVIRPTESDEPVCRILTHPDDSLGTLYTRPDHRKKGLAEWVVRGHIISRRGLIVPPESDRRGQDEGKAAEAAEEDLEGEGGYSYAVIFEGNTASQSLFRKLGWERQWDCAWVYIGSEEDRQRGREVKGLREGLGNSELARTNTLEGRGGVESSAKGA